MQLVSSEDGGYMSKHEMVFVYVWLQINNVLTTSCVDVFFRIFE
jgi:hypothetical protein